MPELTVGADVIVDNVPYKLTEITQRAVMKDGSAVAVNIAILDRDDRNVKCAATELQWSEEDKAFYLPGRVLSGFDRDVYAEMIGNGQRPKAEYHMTARTLLKTLPAAEVSAAAAKVLAKYKKRAEAAGTLMDMKRLVGESVLDLSSLQ